MFLYNYLKTFITRLFNYKRLIKDDLPSVPKTLDDITNIFSNIDGIDIHTVMNLFKNNIKDVDILNNDIDQNKYGSIDYPDGSLYIGCVVNGKREGHGVMRYPKCIWARAFFVNDVISNNPIKPILVCEDSYIYIGDLDKGQPHGYGVLKSIKGSIYKGNFKHGKKHGYGKYSTDNGTNYSGNYEDNFPNGYGIMFNIDVKLGEYQQTYKGTWKNGNKHGKGIYTYIDGAIYNGNFIDDKRDGYGKLIYSDKSCYEGVWKEGLKHGYGKHTFDDGSYYEGVYKNDFPNGDGFMQGCDGNVYKGEWVNGKFNGYGIYRWKDGSEYLGSFSNNVRHGYGRMTYANTDTNAKYAGQWYNGLRHGFGSLYKLNNGKYVCTYRGDWIDGYPDPNSENYANNETDEN